MGSLSVEEDCSVEAADSAWARFAAAAVVDLVEVYWCSPGVREVGSYWKVEFGSMLSRLGQVLARLVEACLMDCLGVMTVGKLAKCRYNMEVDLPLRL